MRQELRMSWNWVAILVSVILLTGFSSAPLCGEQKNSHRQEGTCVMNVGYEMEPTSSFCLCRDRSELSSHEAVFAKVTRRGRKVIDCVTARFGSELPSPWGHPWPHDLHCLLLEDGALLLTFVRRRGIDRGVRVTGPGDQPYPSQLLLSPFPTPEPSRLQLL